MAVSKKQGIKQQLSSLRQEYKDLLVQIEKMSPHQNVTDVALGRLIRQQHTLKDKIKKLEDELIPDLHA